MSDISLNQNLGGSSSGTGGPVTLPFTAGIQKKLAEKRATDANIPAGALAIEIEVLFAGEPITIDGKDYELGNPFRLESKVDWVAKTMELLSAINIISNGNEYHLTVYYPSSDPIDLTTI